MPTLQQVEQRLQQGDRGGASRLLGSKRTRSNDGGSGDLRDWARGRRTEAPGMEMRCVQRGCKSDEEVERDRLARQAAREQHRKPRSNVAASDVGQPGKGQPGKGQPAGQPAGKVTTQAAIYIALEAIRGYKAEQDAKRRAKKKRKRSRTASEDLISTDSESSDSD